MIPDWYHLHKTCYDPSSMICRGHLAKAKLLATLYPQLWHGRVLMLFRRRRITVPKPKTMEVLDQLTAYLRERQDYLPDYVRRRQRRYISSAQAEKGNDLIVTTRQKKQGMHWSVDTSDALAALKTLMLNHGWELYRRQRQVLPLAVPA